MKAFTALFASMVLLSSGGCKKAEEDKGTGGTGGTGGGAEGKPEAKETVGGGAPNAVEIAISCGSVGKDYETCKAGTEAWAKKTGHKVKLVTGPTSSTEALALYQQLLAAGATDIDVFNLDVIWPGILGTFFIDLKEYSNGAEKEHFPAIVQNNTVDGKLVAMPWFTDAGVLYYRKDLLEKHKEKVPTTWEELSATAKKIQDAERKEGKKDMWGFVFQGKAYEGLTCNALEWITSYGGGGIVEPDGKVSIDNPQAAAAIEQAASWIGTISPKGVLSYEEEEARGVFQSGNAVFMRNWPYAYQLAQDDEEPDQGQGRRCRPAQGLGSQRSLGGHAGRLEPRRLQVLQAPQGGGRARPLSDRSRGAEAARDGRRLPSDHHQALRGQGGPGRRTRRSPSSARRSRTPCRARRRRPRASTTRPAPSSGTRCTRC